MKESYKKLIKLILQIFKRKNKKLKSLITYKISLIGVFLNGHNYYSKEKKNMLAQRKTFQKEMNSYAFLSGKS